MIRLGGDVMFLKVPLAIGTLQWGTTWLDDKVINRTGMLSEEVCMQILQTVAQAGVTLLDTAEGYGGGTSEKRLGRLNAILVQDDNDDDMMKENEDSRKISTCGNEFLFMTKFLPAPWRCFHSDFEWAVRQSCRRLQVDCIPIYLLHSPVHWRPIEYWVESAAICKRKGFITAMGLSNASAEQVQRAVKAGKQFGIDIVCNQVHYSLLDYKSHNLQRMEKVCRELDVTIVAFTPLGQGLLTDNLTDEKFNANKPAKMLRLTRNDLEPLRAVIADLARRYQKTMAQVCLNWCIQHDVVPLVGCRTVQQARDSVGCLNWSLAPSDVERLDQVALDRSTLESPSWRRALFVCLFGFVNIICRTMDQWGFAKPPPPPAVHVTPTHGEGKKKDT